METVHYLWAVSYLSILNNIKNTYERLKTDRRNGAAFS